MATQTSTQIAREAPFMEDYRRRLLDSIFAPVERYKEGDTLPPGAKVGDPIPGTGGLASQRIPQQERGIASFAPTESAAFTAAAQQMGFDPATGQQTGVASFEPFIQQAQQGLTSAMGTTALGIPSLQAAQQQFDPTTARS